MENIDMSSVQLITDSYQNYHRSVYLYILYKIGKDEDAKDLAQDVFLRLMDYKQMLRPGFWVSLLVDVFVLSFSDGHSCPCS